MNFDKSKVFTVFNCEEVKIGSKGYVADYKEDLIERVQSEDEGYYLTLQRIEDCNDFSFRIDSGGLYRYFYLVEEPKEPTKRPCTMEELLEMLKKQGLPMLLRKVTGHLYTVIYLDENKVEMKYGVDYAGLCEQFTLLDGTELWVEE